MYPSCTTRRKWKKNEKTNEKIVKIHLCIVGLQSKSPASVEDSSPPCHRTWEHLQRLHELAHRSLQPQHQGLVKTYETRVVCEKPSEFLPAIQLYFGCKNSRIRIVRSSDSSFVFCCAIAHQEQTSKSGIKKEVEIAKDIFRLNLFETPQRLDLLSYRAIHPSNSSAPNIPSSWTHLAQLNIPLITWI